MGSPIALDTVVVQTQDILSSDIDDEVVLLSMETDAYYGLDPVSADIWKRLDQPCVIEDVCAQLVSEYDIDPETCQQDVLAFVTKLIEAKLVRAVSS